MDTLSIHEIVQNYLNETRLTLRGFAEALMEKIVSDEEIITLSHAAVSAWAQGQSEPKTDLLTLILMRYKDWRFDFALACLAAKRPDVWGVGGGIWEVAHLLRLQNVALTDELIDEHTLTAELTEQLEEEGGE